MPHLGIVFNKELPSKGAMAVGARTARDAGGAGVIATSANDGLEIFVEPHKTHQRLKYDEQTWYNPQALNKLKWRANYLQEKTKMGRVHVAYYIQTQNQIIWDVQNKITKILPMGQQRNDARYREKETY